MHVPAAGMSRHRAARRTIGPIRTAPCARGGHRSCSRTAPQARPMGAAAASR